MTAGEPPDEAALAAEVRAFARARFDPDMALVEWRRLLVEEGWAIPSWPPSFGGRDLPTWTDGVAAQALVEAGAVGVPVGVATALAGPTILHHGPQATRERFLRPLLTGEQRWCQLFSEPGAGSDLAGLSTTAVAADGQWVVSGQKVWSTSAQCADLGMLLARTDWSAPKHEGLTFFVLPMRQDGVEVRPLRQMNGYASFNEVFLSDAVVPADHVVGEVGGGWAVARTTLAHERRFGALAPPAYGPGPGRALEEARAEVAAHLATYRWYPQRAGRPDLLVEHARLARRGADPIVRQEVASAWSLAKASGWTASRARAARPGPPGAEGSMGKLAMSELARRAGATHARTAGVAATTTGSSSPLGGIVAEILTSVPAQSIAGGTDEIQRTVVAERLLGLPREPAVDVERPFKEVRRNV